MGEEGPLYPNPASWPPADGEGGIITPVPGIKDCAFEFLDAFSGSFGNFHVYTDYITGP